MHTRIPWGTLNCTNAQASPRYSNLIYRDGENGRGIRVCVCVCICMFNIPPSGSNVFRVENHWNHEDGMTCCYGLNYVPPKDLWKS